MAKSQVKKGSWSKVGSFFRIPLADGTFGYGRVLPSPDTAFYDYRTKTPSDDLQTIAAKPVLFRVAVLASDLKRWDVIGIAPLEGDVARPVVNFVQDRQDHRKCTIYDTEGLERAATPEECVGLERAAVWEAHHVEARLLDAFEGRPNETVEFLRVKLS